MKARSFPMPDRLGTRLSSRAESLTPSLRRVASFIDGNRLDVLTKSAAELAALIGTSDATVIRAVKALGFDGLPDLRHQLAGAIGKGLSPVDNLERTLSEVAKAPMDAVELVLASQLDIIAAMRTSEIKDRIHATIQVLAQAARIVVCGIGPSRFVAGYAGLLLARNGRQTHVLDASGSSLADQLLSLNGGDAVLMLAYGRKYIEATAVVATARERKLPIVLVSDSLDERLARHAKVIVPVARGKAEQVALHGATLVCLEAVILGLAAADQPKAVASLGRLNELRGLIRRKPKND